MTEPRTAAGRRLHARIFGLSDRMPDGAELDNLILAIEAEAADHPPYPTPDEFAGMTHEQFVAFLDRIGVRRFTEAKPAPPDAPRTAAAEAREGVVAELLHAESLVEQGYEALRKATATLAGIEIREAAALPKSGEPE